jgi:hypothetical protein
LPATPGLSCPETFKIISLSSVAILYSIDLEVTKIGNLFVYKKESFIFSNNNK